MALLDPIGNWFRKTSNIIIFAGIFCIIFNMSFYTDVLIWFILSFVNFVIHYFFVILGIFAIIYGLLLKSEGV